MSNNRALSFETTDAFGSDAVDMRLFGTFDIGILTFTTIEGDVPGTFDGIIRFVNPQFAKVVGRSQASLIGERLVRGFNGDTFVPLITACRVAGELNDVVKATVEVSLGGEDFFFDAACIATGEVYRAALVDVTGFVAANRSLERRNGELLFVNDALESQATDLAQLAEEIEASRQTLDIEVERRTKLENELRRMAHFDELTGIANRRSFLTDAQTLLDTDTPDQQCALILLDIDHFKTINDTFGHGTGDDVLRRVCALISEEIDQLDTLFGRIGGEEFALLLPRADLVEAHGFAEWIRSRICETDFHADNVTINMTVSFGVTERRRGETDLTKMIARADVALYAAKAAGRNNVQLAQN